MTEQGHVLAVTLEKLGDDLAAAASAGATSLVVSDIADFDELGGALWINGEVLAYSSADDDTGAITLINPLGANAAAGDKVFAWDPGRQAIVTDLVAQVQVDGDVEGDPHECSVEFKLVKDLAGGIRGLIGESVLIEEEDDDWRVIDVLGLSDANAGLGAKWEADDTYVLTAADVTAGTATFPLTFKPISESLYATFGVMGQRPTNYTINYDAQTITWPLSGWEQAGDRIWVHYEYRQGITQPNTINFGSAGWKYLDVAEADSTDRSGTSFDDTGFTTGTFPISNSTAVHPASGWLTPVTAGWPVHTAMWARRTITAIPGHDVALAIRVDDYLDGVWWNGTLIHGPEASSTPYGERTLTVDGADVRLSNVLAIKARDASAGARTYLDAEAQV